MALNQLGLGFVFTAHDLASGTIGGLRSRVSGLGNDSRAAGSAMRAGFGIAAAGIVPLAAGIAGLATAMGLAESASEFERNVVRVGNIAHATGDELAMLRDEAIQVGLSSQFSPNEAIGGLEALAASGFDATASMRILHQALTLATGGNISIESATEAATSAIHVFSLNVEEQSTMVDHLLAIEQATALQATDLTLAIGGVSRGAQQTSQSMDEMLISMGLIRNAGIDVSVASSATSMALQHMATNAQGFREIGVSVTDAATGQFRDFLDIVVETSEALDARYTNAAERAAASSDLFGARGIAAFTNITTQLQTMVENSNGRLATMQDAVRELRDQLENSAGMAEVFSNAMMDTFEGQQRAMRATAETMRIVFGGPFARVFKPFVTIVVSAIRNITNLFHALPEGVQTAIAGVFVATSAFLALGGAILVVSGLAVAIAPVFLAVVKVALLLSLAMAPVILATLAFAAAITVMVVAVRANMGGLGDFFAHTWQRIQLGWEALQQLFTNGGFSGAVRVEMQRAENTGLRRFVIDLFRIGARVRVFFDGFVEAWGKAMIRITPAFERVRVAFERVGEALGFVGEKGAATIANTRFEDWAMKGAQAAEILAGAVEGIADAVAFVGNFFADFVKGFRSQWDTIQPSIDHVTESLGRLFGGFGDQTAAGSDEAKSFGVQVGEVFAKIVGGTADVVAAFADIANAIKDAFGPIMDAVHWLQQLNGGPMTEAERNSMPSANPIQGVFDLAGQAGNAIAPTVTALRTPEARQSRADFEAQMPPADPLTAAWRLAGWVGEQLAPNAAPMPRATPPAVAEAEARQQVREGDNRALAEQVAALARQQAQTPPVNVVIDGQVVARTVANANRSAQATGFVPAPVSTE